MTTPEIEHITMTSVSESHHNRFPLLQEFGESYAHVHGPLALAVCSFGLVCNVVNVIVLTRPSMTSQTNVLLVWIAVANLLTMATYLPFSWHFYVSRDFSIPEMHATRSKAWIYFLLFQVSFSLVCHTIAIWLSSALAIFRCLFIRFPGNAQTLCSMTRVKAVIAIVYASSVIIFVPNYLLNCLKVKPTTPPNNTDVTVNVNITLYYAVENIGGDYPLLAQLNFWINAVVVKLIPCALLTLLTILLVVTMKRAQKRHQRLVKHKTEACERGQETQRTTRMLTAVVILFLASELPQGLLTTVALCEPLLFIELYQPLGDLLDMLALVSSAATFVLYCTMSKQFRTAFVDCVVPRGLMTSAATKGGGWQPVMRVDKA